MIDVETRRYIKEEVKEEVYKTLKELGYSPKDSSQSTLTPCTVTIDPEDEEYMKDKQCLVWLGSTGKGLEQGVRCNQFYISKRGSMAVEIPIPLYFDEVFNIWESYFKGNSLEDIYFTVVFEEENVRLSDLRLVVWALVHGKCNYVLNFINEDRYLFDFKKYARRF